MSVKAIEERPMQSLNHYELNEIEINARRLRAEYTSSMLKSMLARLSTLLHITPVASKA